MSQQIYIIQHYDSDRVVDVPEEIGHHKIGISTNPDKRLSILQGGTPFDLRLITTIEIDGDATAVEERLQQLYLHAHVRGEWYRLVESDLEAFKSINKISEDRLEAIYSDIHLLGTEDNNPAVKINNRL